MSDFFYDLVWTVGAPAFLLSGDSIVRGRNHIPRTGGFLLAANHQCAYDVPLIMLHTPRRVDFVSIVEIFRKPLVGWFYGSMNAFPLDRGKADAKTVRTILDRLERGRAVCMFPEGGFRRGDASMIQTRRIKPGIGRLATLANVPIIPCAIAGSPAFADPTAWLPFRSTRYGVAFGEPIPPTVAPAAIELLLIQSIAMLYGDVQNAGHSCRSLKTPRL